MTYRTFLIETNRINPHPTPPPDTRPTLRIDDWATHEAARTIAETAHDGILGRLTGELGELVRQYRH